MRHLPFPSKPSYWLLEIAVTAVPLVGTPSPVNPAEDELVGGAPSPEEEASTADSYPPVSVPSRGPSPPISASISTEELFQQFMKIYAAFVKVLEQNAIQNQGQADSQEQ